MDSPDAANRYRTGSAGVGEAPGAASDRVDLAALGGGSGRKYPRSGKGREQFVAVRRHENIRSRIGERGRTRGGECRNVAAGDRSEVGEVAGKAAGRGPGDKAG